MNSYYLKELIKIRNGKDYKTLNKGKIPVYGTGGIMTYVDSYLFDGESILLPRKGSLNNIGYVNGKFWTIDTMYWCEIDKSLVYPKYLYCYLTMIDTTKKVSGSTLPSMTFDAYYSIKVDLPDLSIQKKVGDYLYSIISSIEMNNQIIEKIENVSKEIYYHWFEQFEFPNTNNLPYKSFGGNLIYNEKIKKEIPKDWNVKLLKECLEHINTGLNPRDNFSLNSGNIKYITVKNLTTNGSIDFSNCDTIDENARKIVHKRSDVSKGDILFASIAPLGRCVIVEEDPDDWDINESVFSIRPNELVTTEYLYSVFMSDYFIKKAEHNSTGSIFSGIRIKVLEDIPILIPSKRVMDDFTKSIKHLYLLKYKKQKENFTLEKIKQTIFPMSLNGQLKIEE